MLCLTTYDQQAQSVTVVVVVVFSNSLQTSSISTRRGVAFGPVAISSTPHCQPAPKPQTLRMSPADPPSSG